MGEEFPLYQQFFYGYQRIKMQRARCVVDYLAGWMMSEFPFTGNENVLLDRMIYQGKIQCILSLAFPEMDPALIMGYTQSEYQWCVEHDIKPGTFYNWVKRLRQKGCVDLPASTGHTYCAPESQEVVRVDFHDTDSIPYEQSLNVIPAATERNNLSVAEPMKLSVGSFHLTIPNGTDPQLLAQTLRIVKELEC